MENQSLIDPSTVRQQSPHDRFNAVFSIFFLLGVGSLLPWNFFINAKQYFMYKLRNTTISDAASWTNSSLYTESQKLYESYVEVSAMIPTIVFILLNVILSKVIIVEKRIIGALVVMIIMFILTVVLTRTSSTDTWQNLFFIVSLLSVAVMNAASAMLQGGSCGLASFFPAKYMQALMAGQGLGGLLASIASIVTLSLHTTPVLSGFVYFLIALSVIIASLAGFLILTQFTYYKFHVTGNTHSSVLTVNVTEDESEDELAVIFEASRPSHCSQMTTVLKQVWIDGFVSFFVFAITLSCFPAITSAIQSVSSDSSEWNRLYFVPVSCFLLFNLSDFIGRTLSGVFQWPAESNQMLLVLFALIRVGFVPVFLLCNVDISQRRLPTVFNNDIVPIVSECLFGLSNGYLSTLGMMYGPRRVDIANVEIAGGMMAFFLSLGLGTGALLSVLMVKVVA